MQLFATPNDPRFRELYGLDNTGQTGGVADADIDAPEGWDVAGMGAFPQSGGVKVGIVDTGITQTHEDLAGKTVDCGQSVAGRIASGACLDDSHDVLIVAAAGNDGNATLNYPAA